MTTFKEDEESVEDSMPRDGFEFVLPTVTYRLASGTKNLVINGQTFRAGTIQRSGIDVTTATNEASLEVSLLVSHALPQRYLRGGVPPRRIDVNVYRKQVRSDASELAFIGRVISMSIDRHVATFLVPSRTSDALQRRLPTITLGRDCPHVLYQSGCNVSVAAFTASLTVVSVNGATVTLSAAPNAVDDWAKWGELIHTASGERQMIKSQTGATVVMQLPIADIVAGDAVQVTAGCSHDVDTCMAKFTNQVNFGGTPQRPSGNPFIPSNRGIFSMKKFGL